MVIVWFFNLTQRIGYYVCNRMLFFSIHSGQKKRQSRLKLERCPFINTPKFNSIKNIFIIFNRLTFFFCHSGLTNFSMFVICISPWYLQASPSTWRVYIKWRLACMMLWADLRCVIYHFFFVMNLFIWLVFFLVLLVLLKCYPSEVNLVVSKIGDGFIV